MNGEESEIFAALEKIAEVVAADPARGITSSREMRQSQIIWTN